ncbi:hypothetical protein [Desulfosarcina ovata]|nr:hypothetical protein [Desulfosarcina ovata]
MKLKSGNWSPDIDISAYRFAAEAHWNSKKQQFVPGTDIPYPMHFTWVAMEVMAALEKESNLDGNLARIRQQPREIWMVKMADRITNLQRPPKNWMPDKINRYREEAIIIHDRLKEGSEYLAGRLLKKVNDYPERYQEEN